MTKNTKAPARSRKPMTPDDLAAVRGETAVRHSNRFRKVSTRYPRQVAIAYDRDLKRAAVDSDEQVAATVAAWERSRGLNPRDWAAVGAAERDSAHDEPEPLA